MASHRVVMDNFVAQPTQTDKKTFSFVFNPNFRSEVFLVFSLCHLCGRVTASSSLSR